MRHVAKTSLLLLLAIALSLLSTAGAQDRSQPAPKSKEQTAPAVNRLTIEVTGGDKNVPVENASIYVRLTPDRKGKKDKKFELNVKTNRDGVAHVPDPPQGRVVIQVIAEGWKTFGQAFDISDPQQTIQIHLVRPPQWY